MAHDFAGTKIFWTNFRGDEKFTTRDATLSNGLAHLCFIAVHLRGVDMAIPSLQGPANNLAALITFMGKSAETELGMAPMSFI